MATVAYELGRRRKMTLNEWLKEFKTTLPDEALCNRVWDALDKDDENVMFDPILSIILGVMAFTLEYGLPEIA